MSEKEKRVLEGITKLPGPLRERFLDKIEGAVMALDALGALPQGDQKGGQDEPRESRVS
jgi:hypothetical protein